MNLIIKPTAVVVLCLAFPHGARCLILPRNTEEIVLQKLDFPAPTGPSISNRNSDMLDSDIGLDASTSSISLAKYYNKMQHQFYCDTVSSKPKIKSINLNL